MAELAAPARSCSTSARPPICAPAACTDLATHPLPRLVDAGSLLLAGHRRSCDVRHRSRSRTPDRRARSASGLRRFSTRASMVRCVTRRPKPDADGGCARSIGRPSPPQQASRRSDPRDAHPRRPGQAAGRGRRHVRRRRSHATTWSTTCCRLRQDRSLAQGGRACGRRAPRANGCSTSPQAPARRRRRSRPTAPPCVACDFSLGMLAAGRPPKGRRGSRRECASSPATRLRCRSPMSPSTRSRSRSACATCTTSTPRCATCAG